MRSSGLLCLKIMLALLACSGRTKAEPLSPDQRKTFEQAAGDLNSAINVHPRKGDRAAADCAIFSKGLAWALRYDRDFSESDVKLLQAAVDRGKSRIDHLTADRPTWMSRRGKIALGYRSKVDDSVQPYGLIVPKDYDSAKPQRLDVVLHGSTSPVGMSELRFMSRFDEGDGENAAPPEQPYIELHPLGRVENCYRWSGETDVFEAIEDVCQRYNIDRQRIVVRGMSMGASGTWHLGLKHPGRFAALGPYCGYVDTHRFSESPVPGFVRVGPLPEHQERGLHMLDSVDYAANAGVVPTIACMGEKDVFFQAHVIMGEAMEREGLRMTNLISPGTGHVIDPKTHGEQLSQIAAKIAEVGRPQELRFVTWTLKYNRCHWLEVLALDKHYVRAEISAKLNDGVIAIAEPMNINRFAVRLGELPGTATKVRIGKSDLAIPPDSEEISLAREKEGWVLDIGGPTIINGKRPGLQGPIDDAFTTPFVCVRGTGKPWNAAVQKYADASLGRFAEEWRHYFRGEPPIKDDIQITEEDLAKRNLVLFGDPGSNSLIAKSLPGLPLSWTKEKLQLGGLDVSSADHVPALIAPNPLEGGHERYIVLNSGHTFREADLAKFNYLLFPRWGDWACLQLDVPTQTGTMIADHVIKAGYFDERWSWPSKP